jgi:hypothetical protein
MKINPFDHRSPVLLRKVARRLWMRYGFQWAPTLSYSLYLHALERHYRRSGIQRGLFALSFDCDLEEDMLVTDAVRETLDSLELKASWAMIGRWMERFPKVIQRLLENGHEIVNHTMTHPNNRWLRPEDTRKFHQISADERQEEISRCHIVVREAFDYEMRGFRAPHFCMTDDCYPILSSLGYYYSSSNPLYLDSALGAIHGAPGGMIEMPLSTSPSMPRQTLESYRLYRAPNGQYRDEHDFYEHWRSMVEMTAHWRIVSIVYMDPCDIIRLGQPHFKEYLRLLTSADLEVVKMDEIAARLRDIVMA